MSEFVMWTHYDQLLMNRHEKLDYYLAQIAVELRRVFATKKSRRVRIKDFLLKFKFGQEKKTPLSKEEQTRMAKMFWMASGIKGKYTRK